MVIAFDGDTYDTWYGEPGRTDKQPKTVIEVAHRHIVNNSTLTESFDSPSLTPRKSFYVCIMSYSHDLPEPNDIMYFAVAQNERSLSPKREVLGHRYQRR